MQGAPPVDGFVDDGNVHEADDGEDGSGTRTGRCASHVTTQHDVGNVDEPENKGGGQASIPRPPCSPGGTSPDRAGDQSQGDENGSYFSGSAGQPVPTFIFLPEVSDARDTH